MADNERRKEYQTYLHDMNEKLKDRPLLFERESQTNARNKAQKRYEEILRGAGIQGEELGSFLEGEAVSDVTSNPVSYVIAQSESGDEDDDFDEQYESEKTNEDGSEVVDDGTEDDGSYVPPESESESNDIESDLEN